MLLTCRYRFAASHRLDSPALSAEENRKLYGKCNNPYGHGHSYALDVTVEGPVDANGQVVDREALDRLVRQNVLRVVDHKNLNQDVPAFFEVPTTENLAALIERMLMEHWDLTARLARIRISETERNTIELRSELRSEWEATGK
jgi:6-pyruvoyltetrahydropterin/6-carboxytetrahydropterin synthase